MDFRSRIEWLNRAALTYEYDKMLAEINENISDAHFKTQLISAVENKRKRNSRTNILTKTSTNTLPDKPEPEKPKPKEEEPDDEPEEMFSLFD